MNQNQWRIEISANLIVMAMYLEIKIIKLFLLIANIYFDCYQGY